MTIFRIVYCKDCDYREEVAFLGTALSKHDIHEATNSDHDCRVSVEYERKEPQCQ